MSAVAAQRTFSVFNNCPFTIWPALFTSAGGRPAQATGWSQNAFATVTFSVPSDWNGRIWAAETATSRSTTAPIPASTGAATADWNGNLSFFHSGYPVDAYGAMRRAFPPHPWQNSTSVPAAPIFTTAMSLVDGYNLPVRIDNTAGCPIPECAVDVGPNCPATLKGPFDSTGFPVGCKSACLVDALNGNAANSPNCCSGSFDTPET
ncbi:thaumatin [Mycena vulgaris]|nr:thaumatin [Mycena vulgaris]